MRLHKICLIGIAILVFLAVSCSYNFPVESEKRDGVNLPENFSRFYIIGDTYSSGFMDGSLYSGGQEFSYPNLLGDKLNEMYEQPVFQQAEITSETGYNKEASIVEGTTRGKFSLIYRAVDSIYPMRKSSEGDLLTEWQGSAMNLNDFSLPELKSYEVDNADELKDNPYFNRIIQDNTTIVDVVINNDPGIVLLSLGYDDILSYALNGGSGNENPGPDSITEVDLTSSELFESSLNRVIDRLLNDTDADLFLANLFNPLDAPYFQTLSYALEIEKYSFSYIGGLGSYYSDFNYKVFQYNDIENGGVPPESERPIIIFDPMGYPLVNPPNRARTIEDKYLNEATLNDGTEIPKWRQLTEGELVLYKNEPKLNEASRLSGETPLSDRQALTAPEIQFIEQRVESFNTIIEELISEHERIHLVDIKSIINLIRAEEYSYEGVRPSLEFGRYGIFSSDGYTFNPRGNAIIANQLIKAINSAFNAKLELIDINSLRGTDILGSFD